MTIELHLTDHDIDRIAARVAEHLSHPDEKVEHWLDVTGAADHLALTENAMRGLVKRREIPCHRTHNGRLRFSVTELDHWVRTGTCRTARGDLP